MKIFALETDIRKLNKELLAPHEEEVLCVRFHGIRFGMAVLKALIYTLLLGALAVAGWYGGLAGTYAAGSAAILWPFLIGLPLLRSFIDWRFDEVLLTTDKIVVVDQSSIVRQEIKQMNLENLASVNAVTQYWGLFPFGMLCFDLKEGTGARICLSYIPQAQRVASIISDTLVHSLRRKSATAL